ncbi:MAG: deoxyhypusine synthase [Candidatus Micrarchaeia archaeon]
MASKKSVAVRDMRLRRDMSIKELLNQMYCSGGFTAKHVAIGHQILKKMLSDEKCTNFLSFPACIVSTGLRGVLAQAVKHFDVIITTCGTLDHDLARAWGGEYLHGTFSADDRKLHRKGINRIGNIFVSNESYGRIIERKMQPILKELSDKKSEWGGRELIGEFGRRLKDRNSILCQAARHNVPIYVPGFFDGAFGTQILLFSQDRKIKIDLIKDEKELCDIIFESKRTGALMMGGGISKHHTIWWNQFKGGLDYAVYITTATQYDGSLSGARLEEAISWGKIKENARFVTIDGDATVILPLLILPLL